MAESVTVNYAWTKPEVGASVDNWGGFLNADLDSIDGIVHDIDTTAVRDAPNDGTTYGRNSAAWSHLTHNDITDWASAAAPPVVISGVAPSSPTVGALWWDSTGGQLYTFYNDGNSSQWVIAVNAAAFLLPASTTVLGGVKVDGTTIKAAADGTISTTVVPLGDNRIINGDMRIDQRNNGASGTAQGYTADRWFYQAAQAGKGTWQRWTAGAGAVALGIGYALQFTSSSAYTLLAGDYFDFFQNVEADMVSDFAWGTANAQPVTLSFWVTSSLAGTFGGAIQNTAATRSYPFSYSLPANVWTKITITIPGDTSGTWVLQGNGVGVHVAFSLGVGSTYAGPANIWASGNYISATGSVSVVATNSASFYVTGVKLEIGSVATPFNRQSLAKSMADCERYFRWIGFNMQFTAAAASQIQQQGVFFPAMRAAPTIGAVTPDPNTTQNVSNQTSTTTLMTPYSARQSITATVSGASYLVGYRTSADAEL